MVVFPHFYYINKSFESNGYFCRIRTHLIFTIIMMQCVQQSRIKVKYIVIVISKKNYFRDESSDESASEMDVEVRFMWLDL